MMSPTGEEAGLLPENVVLDVAGDDGDWTLAITDVMVRMQAAVTAVWRETPMARELSKRRQVEISMLLTHDAQMRELNREYRGKNKPTNVLSFPGMDTDTLSVAGYDGPGLPSVALGDVVISLETAMAEAEDAGKALVDHVSHLTVHGLLHLLGYDHEDDEEAATMEALEVRILAHLHIDDPYAT